jgi:hypothetical protein
MPAPKRTIEVVVSPTGAIQIEAKEFKGRGCEEATRFLEEALGQVKTRRKKPEYTQINTTHTRGSQSVGS